MASRMTILEQRVERLETLPSQVDALRREMHERFDAVEQVLISLQTQIADNHRYTLVLHEDLVASIAAIGEARPRRSNRRKKR